MNIGVIFAGGVGTRMNSKDMPKQFLKVFNKPIIIHTLDYFQKNENIDAIVISCVAEHIDYLKKLLYRYRIDKVKKVVPGGKTGQLSIYNGLCAAKEISGDEKSIVLIHDGVRPLINEQLISDNILCVRENGSAITIVPATETIATVDDCKRVTAVTDRAMYYIARAPQSFYLSDILEAHRKAVEQGIASTMIDSAMLMTHYGYKLYTVEGPQENIKVTTPSDFYVCRALLQAKENSQIWGN